MTTITWTTGDGRKVELTLSVEFGLDRQGRRRTSGRKEVVESVTLDGEPVAHAYCVTKTSHPVAVAKIGNIGINQANYDRYLAAYAEVEATFAEHNAACDRHEAMLDAVSDASAKII